ncbi:MAG: class IV adenylate cyclase [Pseudomonadota bacterium]
MALEIELKFLGNDLAALSERMQALGAVSEGKHLERNLVFDNAEGSLRPAKTLLRLRRQQWAAAERCVLTLKKPVDGVVQGVGDALVKVRQEDEISFANYDAALNILHGLGYASIFGYDKVREEFRLTVFDDVKNEFHVHVALDSLVFGDVVEIEGSQEAIFTAAQCLGLDKSEQSTASYHTLHRKWREKQGLPMQDDFTFDAKTIDDICISLGIA